ncbi:hypothetical protein [Vibrio sp.]|uniref:hypothetical protein n=1 Tax=Vibrio sp. TaxID=678 RepID=UPI0037A485C5
MPKTLFLLAALQVVQPVGDQKCEFVTYEDRAELGVYINTSPDWQELNPIRINIINTTTNAHRLVIKYLNYINIGYPASSNVYIATNIDNVPRHSSYWMNNEYTPVFTSNELKLYAYVIGSPSSNTSHSSIHAPWELECVRI